METPSGQYIESISDLDGLYNIQNTSPTVDFSEPAMRKDLARAGTSSSSLNVHAQGRHLVASCKYTLCSPIQVFAARIRGKGMISARWCMLSLEECSAGQSKLSSLIGTVLLSSRPYLGFSPVKAVSTQHAHPAPRTPPPDPRWHTCYSADSTRPRSSCSSPASCTWAAGASSRSPLAPACPTRWRPCYLQSHRSRSAHRM